MDYYLLIDFGSTYTKLTAVDIEKEEIAATAKAITSIESNIMDGFNAAMAVIDEKLGRQAHYIKKLACSSAAGGLKFFTGASPSSSPALLAGNGAATTG